MLPDRRPHISAYEEGLRSHAPAGQLSAHLAAYGATERIGMSAAPDRRGPPHFGFDARRTGGRPMLPHRRPLISPYEDGPRSNTSAAQRRAHLATHGATGRMAMPVAPEHRGPSRFGLYTQGTGGRTNVA
jgi:hypothetical protein